MRPPVSPGSLFKVRNYSPAAQLAHAEGKPNPNQEGQGNLFPVTTCWRSNVFTSGAGRRPWLGTVAEWGTIRLGWGRRKILEWGFNPETVYISIKTWAITLEFGFTQAFCETFPIRINVLRDKKSCEELLSTQEVSSSPVTISISDASTQEKSGNLGGVNYMKVIGVIWYPPEFQEGKKKPLNYFSF